MKLIHTSDWHLGSPMEHRLGREKADMRRRELLSRFADMMIYAREQNIDAVLLCGDLSDDGILPAETQDYLLSLIADAAPVRFFLIAGNHDRIGGKTVCGCFARGRRALPDNLCVFGEEWHTENLSECVTVTGRSLDGGVLTPDLPGLDSGCYNIVMLHGQITESSSVLGGADDLIPLTGLRGRNIDYLALGHEHTFRHKKLDARGTWCYSGCPEGRGFDECGPKGFVVLSLDGTYCTGASFVPFSKRCFHDLQLDVTSLGGGVYDAEQALGAVVRDIPAADIVRVTLCGNVSGDLPLDVRYLQNRLSERFFHAELRDARECTVDTHAYEGDLSLRGAFVRAVTESDMTDEEKAAVLRCGLAALAGQGDPSFPRGEDMQ